MSENTMFCFVVSAFVVKSETYKLVKKVSKNNLESLSAL